jgi:eukaryotic-like serine/threonine-protein kinase
MDLIGKYEIQGELGKGGFGVVYRGWDPVMRRGVAIKVINTQAISEEPGILARLRAEARTTGNLRHQNIVTVYDTGEHLGQPYIVMELLEGRTLRDSIRSEQALELWEKVNVLVQVAEGLNFAHASGVVHRDVKPSNVMLKEGAWVKVLDFGTARFRDQSLTHHSTTEGVILGTIPYMAPELLDGKPSDILTDIYSFGVTCYEFLTRTQPFRANSVGQMLVSVARLALLPLNQLVPNCPPLLHQVVHRATAKDRSQRYRSLQDLLYDLAPVEISLRRDRAIECADIAAALIAKNDLGNAGHWLRKALEIDPAITRGQEL